MFSKFSVKRPLTIVVAAILVLILGFVSFTGMTTDLLPKMDLPYVIVATTCPGASPEKVELTVTKPLEQALATTSGVEEVTSVSSENYSMVILQFTQDTNMDSAMIEMSGNIDLVKGQLDSSVGTPMLMKMNPDMLPIMVASVDMDGKDIREISRFTTDTVIPALERVDGVASISTMGLVEESLRITLDQEKIDALNDKVLASVDKTLADAKSQLDNGDAQLAAAKQQLEQTKEEKTTQLLDAQQKLSNGKQQLQDALDAIPASLTKAQKERQKLVEQKTQLEEAIKQMTDAGLPVPEEQQKALEQLVSGITAYDQGIAQAQGQQTALTQQLSQLEEQEKQLEAGKMALTEEMSKASMQLSDTEQQLKEGREELEASRDAAYEQAGIGGLITKENISSILTAENFSMPAGYLTEGNDQYLVKVGDSFSSVEELENLELFTVDAGGIGTIKLSDVAEVAFTDNAEEMYAKINGNDGILLTFQKQSTVSTSEVSKDLNEQIETLMAEQQGLHITALEDQGIYIGIVIDSVLQNLLMGGLLAVVILFLFLRNLRSTLIIAVSIPMSLMFAVTLMYFSGVTMNVISLAGLALGVGMLVDNSIVVIENIYRLRAVGMGAAKAAVQGAVQVAGAITASTLTTICVFLPIVFTQGISRQLFTDMGLTIAYSLVASLLVALTLVPTMSSKMMKKEDKTTHKWFERFTGWYGSLLEKALNHKAWVLGGSVLLLVLSIAAAGSMGTAFMPEMDSTQISVSMEMPKGSTVDQTRAMADTLLERMGQVEGVQTVGAMQGGSGSSSMLAGGSDTSVTFYVMLSEKREHTSTEVADEILAKTADLNCTVSAQSSSMNAMSALGSGIEISIRGSDLDTLSTVADDISGIVSGTEGTTEVENPSQESDTVETKITVDKNKAMKYQLTVAQVYQEISAALQTESTATTLSLDSIEYPVIVAQGKDGGLTRETLKDYRFSVEQNGETVEVPLSDIAEITQQQSLSSIRHDNQVRQMTVSAKVDSSHNIGLVSREIEQKLAEYEMPDGYTYEFGGETQNINDTMVELLKMIALAIAFIYLIMVAQFQSFRSPFIVMFTIPLAFTGGLLALFAARMEISVISMLGFLILSGIVVNNGIVFVDYVNQLRLGGMEKRRALVVTGRTRLRPILMTALTTILGLSTLAMGMGMGADMLQPMAVVTIGGLAYATVLTLFVVPAMYDLFNRKPIKQPDLGEEETDAEIHG